MISLKPVSTELLSDYVQGRISCTHKSHFIVDLSAEDKEAVIYSEEQIQDIIKTSIQKIEENSIEELAQSYQNLRKYKEHIQEIGKDFINLVFIHSTQNENLELAANAIAFIINFVKDFPDIVDSFIEKIDMNMINEIVNDEINEVSGLYMEAFITFIPDSLLMPILVDSGILSSLIDLYCYNDSKTSLCECEIYLALLNTIIDRLAIRKENFREVFNEIYQQIAPYSYYSSDAKSFEIYLQALKSCIYYSMDESVYISFITNEYFDHVVVYGINNYSDNHDIALSSIHLFVNFWNFANETKNVLLKMLKRRDLSNWIMNTFEQTSFTDMKEVLINILHHYCSNSKSIAIDHFQKGYPQYFIETFVEYTFEIKTQIIYYLYNFCINSDNDEIFYYLTNIDIFQFYIESLLGLPIDLAISILVEIYFLLVYHRNRQKDTPFYSYMREESVSNVLAQAIEDGNETIQNLCNLILQELQDENESSKI